MFRRLSQFGIFAAVVLLSCCSLKAQSTAGPGPVFGAPESSPAMPVGTTVNPQGHGSFTDSSQSASNSPTVTPLSLDSRVAAQVGSDYKIGADDVLTINVWHEPEVSRSVPVRPDGKISLPLVGDVQAAGMTPPQLQRELESRFSKFLTNPAVSVIVTDIRSQRVNVLGQVFRPGTYPLIPPMSVIDAIATAGGLKEFARPKKIYVLRAMPNGQQERIKFAYNDVLKGKRGSKDMLLQTRDTVVVP